MLKGMFSYALFFSPDKSNGTYERPALTCVYLSREESMAYWFSSQPREGEYQVVHGVNR